jgi:hypothetical protein
MGATTSRVQGAYIHNALNGVPHPTCKRPGKIFAVSLLVFVGGRITTHNNFLLEGWVF